ncbi:hypothetical protein LDENG_00146940 [Lucifuga dentata]|nr:hypothetical protein LDENG_00146940 [Lucifuga dentata]
MADKHLIEQSVSKFKDILQKIQDYPTVEPDSAEHSITPSYNIQFPLGRPSSTNLQAICLYGDCRPRYPDSYFPASSFGAMKRRAAAVNNAESWFDWELAVNSFCEEDASIKDRVYHCCKLVGNETLDCFQKDAPNPNYDPTQEVPLPPLPSAVPFNFDNSTCQG